MRGFTIIAIAAASALLTGCWAMFPDGSGYGEDEYEISFGGVFFKDAHSGRSSRLPGADSNSFVAISRGDLYGKDAQRVYFEDRLIEGANPATFRFMSAPFYGTDGTSVFYKARKLAGADPATMDLSNWPSVTDGTRFYYNGDLLEGAVAHVVEFGRTGFFSDSHGAIFRKNLELERPGEWTDRVVRVDVCDPPSFEARDYGRAEDSKCAYSGVTRLPVKDRASFQFIGGYWWKDRTGVYRDADLMVGADPATADVVFSKSANYDPPLLIPPGDYFLRDKSGCRRLPDEKPAPCPADALPEPAG